MQWKIINEVLNHKQDVCVVMATGQLNYFFVYLELVFGQSDLPNLT